MNYSIYIVIYFVNKKGLKKTKVFIIIKELKFLKFFI